MNEEELLDNIFNMKPMWRKKYRIFWCDLCETYSAGCDHCHGSSCNCMCCEKCRKDLEDFNKLNPRPSSNMLPEETKVVEKYLRLKRLLKECLEENQSGLDMEWLYYNGRFCDSDWETLDLKFEPYETATVKYPEKFTYLKQP